MELSGGEFNEVVRDAAQISGIIVAGLVRHGPIVQENGRPVLHAMVPDSWSETSLCLRVVSSDGLYESANTYQLPDSWSGGLVSIPYPTSHDALLRDLAPGELATRLSAGPCHAEPGMIARLHWNDPESQAATSVLVNSFRSDEVYLYVAEMPVRCMPLEVRGLVAYDTLCPLPDDLTGEVPLTIYRINDGTSQRPVSFNAWLGSG